ncbi:MAG: hypothetical protein ACU84Q_13920 [Gammaproteobacteria bacterium]
MNWDAVGAIAEAVGAIAVVATLVYLSIQIRQNAKSLDRQEEIARAQILQTRADSVTNLGLLVCSTPQSIELMTRLRNTEEIGPEDLSSEENTQAYMILTAVRANLENTFLQYKKGYLPETFYREVGERNNKDMGPLIIRFGLPLTAEFRAELERLNSPANGVESPTQPADEPDR